MRTYEQVAGTLGTYIGLHNRNRCAKGKTAMTMLIKALAVVAAGTVLATSAFAQSALAPRTGLETRRTYPVLAPAPGPIKTNGAQW